MFETKDGTLAPRVATRSRWCLLPRAALLLLASVALGGLLTSCFADEGPKPDPAGTATGDRTTTYDAAGNPFVVPAPDPNAPDYAQKKKEYDEYMAQLAKEPLASSYLGRAGQGVTGLIHGDTRQFLCQLMGATVCAAWAFGVTYAVFGVVNKIKSMRVSTEAEQEGLDVPEFGLKSYPEDAAVVMEA
jgi:Ammonium Transporter Family